ncbi:related to MID1 protein [Ramularia collo-cygni]|uniref:Related to MID1 protein n=1 Tax=Ramularia collo-cygni TaxID=112498 RepID=A0A2D3VHG8_9PEZI|nr:related to MID1 protein [Ramularia collo-cygni]CZT23661.1 related to MID1 protein [Ramularia collo-cygni]
MLPQCPKLTPLQARLFASVTALALLAFVYWSLSSPHFAYAAELFLDGRGLPRSSGEDHNWHRIEDLVGLEESDERSDTGEDEGDHQHHSYERRAVEPTQIRGNNVDTKYDVAAGNTTILEYPRTLLEGNRTESGDGLPSDLEERRLDSVRHADLRKRNELGNEMGNVLETRQEGDLNRTIYISANVCRQPTWNGTGPQIEAPPQLTLYVSTKENNTDLGPGAGNISQTIQPFNGGFANASVVGATGDWRLAVSAPELPEGFTGFWTYSLAASIDGYFHSVETSDAFLFLVDTDHNSALLVTDNLTISEPSDTVYQQWMNLTAPFIMFAANTNLTGLWGMENSYCGLDTFVKANDQIEASREDLLGQETHVQMGMITRGLGKKPKEQFLVTNLNSSSEYRGFLAMRGNSTDYGDGVVGGGGKVWQPVSFTTKSDGNCQLLYNMTFCDEVAYAVPANPNTMATFEELQSFYENYTTTWWAPFNWTLAQIPCNTTADAQYSLAKTCNDCAAAYKEWLCAVSIPRCQDFTNDADYLQIRNVGQPFYNNDSMLDSEFLNSRYVAMPNAPSIQGSNAFDQTYMSSFATNRSRNQQIDEIIKPGPYKEVLPCEDLCYSLMQSCPASIGFVCPYRGRGLEAGYGVRSSNGVTCSYLGAVYYVNAAAGAGMPVWRALAFAAVLGWTLALT